MVCCRIERFFAPCQCKLERVHLSSSLTDLDGLRVQSEEGARMGYTGKQVIHPDQVPIVQAAFSPSPAQTKWSTELIEAFHRHQETGKVFERLWH